MSHSWKISENIQNSRPIWGWHLGCLDLFDQNYRYNIQNTHWKYEHCLFSKYKLLRADKRCSWFTADEGVASLATDKWDSGGQTGQCVCVVVWSEGWRNGGCTEACLLGRLITPLLIAPHAACQPCVCVCLSVYRVAWRNEMCIHKCNMTNKNKLWHLL